MTGIYQTTCELKARRVLQSFPTAFTYRDGWFSITVTNPVDEIEAARLNRLAKAIAESDLQPLPLACFVQL